MVQDILLTFATDSFFLKRTMNEALNIYNLVHYGINTIVRICEVSQLPSP